MKDQLQRILERDVCLQMGDGATFFDYGYAGRGMMGNKCVAISGTEYECRRTIGQLIYVLTDYVYEEVSVISDETFRNQERQRFFQELSDCVQMIMRFRTDTFGHGVVCYWPEIEFKENDDD